MLRDYCKFHYHARAGGLQRSCSTMLVLVWVYRGMDDKFEVQREHVLTVCWFKKKKKRRKKTKTKTGMQGQKCEFSGAASFHWRRKQIRTWNIATRCYQVTEPQLTSSYVRVLTWLYGIIHTEKDGLIIMITESLVGSYVMSVLDSKVDTTWFNV